MNRIKKMFLLIICSVSCVEFYSCNTRSGITSQRTIIIQPFSDIDSQKTNFVYQEMLKVYPYVTLLKPIELPSSAFYKARNRYRADSIIAQLQRKSTKETVILALTGKDISTTKKGVGDWGIMGLGFRPGNACVASDFRLSGKEKLMQFFKVSIHEIGHTQGLPHCPVKTCFMRDAEGRNPTNEEVDFCPKCKEVLIGKGFSFSEKNS